MPGENRPGWWLVDDAGRPLAGPFRERADATLAQPPDGVEWAECGDPAEVYGTPDAAGVVTGRPTPGDRAWEAHLSEQLDRVTDGFGDPLLAHTEKAALIRAIAPLLVESGFDLHDCTGRTHPKDRGGVCLTPTPLHAGVIVTWAQHDQAADHVHDATFSGVQRVMNTALADVLTLRGFRVESFGTAGAYLVRVPQPRDR